MRRLLIALALGSGGLVAGGCAGGTAGYSVSASYASPDLAYVSPGVYVVADYHEPVFYTNNLYWRYSSGVWYSSPRFGSGWRYSRAPSHLLRIDRPYAYVRYRPSTRYQVRRDGRIHVRDHRRARGGYYRR